MIDLGLGLGLGATARPAGKLAPPDGFAFPFARFPLSVYGSGRTDFEPAAYAEDALNGTVFHVDASTGSDGNTGLSAASRLQSVHAAVTKGNATGMPFTVLVRNSGGGIVPRIHGISASGTVRPTRKCAIVMETGPVAFGTHDLIAYAADPVMAGVFVAARSNIARVFDLRATDVFGNPIELARVGSEAALAGDPGPTGLWYNSGTVFKLKLQDGAFVSNDNVMALLLTQNVTLNNAGSDFFLDGARLYGGNDGALHANGIGGNLVCHRVEARLAGGAGALRDGFRIESVRGLAAFQHCRAIGNAKDGFNAHRLDGEPDSLFVLTDRCEGRDNGRFTAQSCNFVTAHEDVVWLDAGGRADANFGAQLHIIEQAQLWAVATQSRHSRGDLPLGGGIMPTEFLSENDAVIWLENTLAEASSGSSWAVRARDASTILKRGHRTIAGQEGTTGTAVIGSF